jgi:glutathione S-transferase
MRSERLILTVDSLYTSPWAMSVYVALQSKDLDFTLQTVDLAAGANHLPAFTQLSPTHRIPLLQHGGFALTESTAIFEYLDETFPDKPLLPTARYDRARARQLMGWIRSDLLPLRAERSTETVFFKASDQPLSVAAQSAAQRLIDVSEGLLKLGAAHVFERWTIADVDLSMMLMRLIASGDDIPLRLRHYAEQQWAHSGIQSWMSHISVR